MASIMKLEISLPRGTFGERVRAVRAAKGFSQAALARRVGISANAMNEIERGKAPNPRANVVRRLAEVLEISADYLLGVGEVEEEPRWEKARRTPAATADDAEAHRVGAAREG